MTLTFDLATCFLITTHCLVVMIICAKLFSNPTMHNKVMGQTRTGSTEVYAQSLSADCDLNLWPSDMVLVSNTCLVIMIIYAKLFSNSNMHNKVMGRTRTGSLEVYAQSLSADCDLNLWPSDMVLVRDTLSCHDDHLCQIIFKSHYALQSYGSDTNRCHWSLCTKFKCWLWPWPLT